MELISGMYSMYSTENYTVLCAMSGYRCDDKKTEINTTMTASSDAGLVPPHLKSKPLFRTVIVGLSLAQAGA